MTKSNYLFRSILKYHTPKMCPYCKDSQSKVLDSKFLVTTLNECINCGLLFRHPLDSLKFNKKFYQEDYEQKDGITTSLPSDKELEGWIASNFSGSGKDYSNKISRIKELVKNLTPKIIDYGASWGYTSYQFVQAGFNTQSYEISKPRAKFGKKLGLDIVTDEVNLNDKVVVFFSSHVIEHVPDIKHMFVLAQKLLRKEGYFVAYCPNGSEKFRSKNPALFHNFWGEVHPNLLSAEFFSIAFKDVPYLIGSDAANDQEIDAWDKQSQVILDTTGNELFVFAKISGQTF